MRIRYEFLDSKKAQTHWNAYIIIDTIQGSLECKKKSWVNRNTDSSIQMEFTSNWYVITKGHRCKEYSVAAAVQERSTISPDSLSTVY